MKKFTYIAGFLVIFLAILITSVCLIYKNKIGPVSSDSTIKEFEVVSGETYLTLSSKLKEQNLIKSKGFYKTYIRLMKPQELQAGKYNLSEDMGVEKIVKIFEKGSNFNANAITVTIPEGKHLTEVAKLYSNNTNNTQDELLSYWNNNDFIDKVIDKYWFVTSDVKQKGIRYALEGYFFPSTYELQNADVTPEYIAYKMLDKMEQVLNKYKTEIENSDYTTHQILTMASIVEHEAIKDSDKATIAGVFYNRLKDGWNLGSCATLGYAISEWKLTYTFKDMQTDSPYNTYKYSGLPIGPGDMPGEKSIEASVNPATTDYYYFMANVCDPTDEDTYFSKTLAEHETYVNKYLTCF